MSGWSVFFPHNSNTSFVKITFLLSQVSLKLFFVYGEEKVCCWYTDMTHTHVDEIKTILNLRLKFLQNYTKYKSLVQKHLNIILKILFSAQG